MGHHISKVMEKNSHDESDYERLSWRHRSHGQGGQSGESRTHKPPRVREAAQDQGAAKERKPGRDKPAITRPQPETERDREDGRKEESVTALAMAATDTMNHVRYGYRDGAESATDGRPWEVQVRNQSSSGSDCARSSNLSGRERPGSGNLGQ
jgi:hypothetical protein